jgi:hypothetical protein
MIIEKPLGGFNNKLSYSKLNYPQCNCGGNCPNFYFNLLSIASRQSGKTYSMCQLIKHYEKHKIVDKDGGIHELRTFLISPTLEANPIFQSLNSLDFENDVYEDYNDGILLDIIEDIKEKKKESDDFKEYVAFYKIFARTPEDKLDKLYDSNPEAFQKLEAQDFAHYNDIPQPRYKNHPINIIILDDLLGTGSFSTKTKSALTNAYIKNRHLGICFAILSQSLKSIPKNIRLNSSVFFLGKFQNHKMVCEDLYEEVSDAVSLDEFTELYKHATGEKYGALIMDLTDGKRFLKNWDIELILGKKNIDNNKEENGE